jgi:hypothetical protein
MAASVKATVVRAGHDYMRSVCGENGWERVLDRLSDEDRRLVAGSASMVQFPVATDGHVFQAFVEHQFHGNRAIAEGVLRRGGAQQADAMLDGVFSVFARFVSPGQAFSRAGSVISSVYSDVTSKTEPAADGKGGVVRLFGLGDSYFVAPWQCGWIERALVRFGAADAKVTERGWDSGQAASDELIYDVRWT